MILFIEFNEIRSIDFICKKPNCVVCLEIFVLNFVMKSSLWVKFVSKNFL